MWQVLTPNCGEENGPQAIYNWKTRALDICMNSLFSSYSCPLCLMSLNQSVTLFRDAFHNLSAKLLSLDINYSSVCREYNLQRWHTLLPSPVSLSLCSWDPWQASSLWWAVRKSYCSMVKKFDLNLSADGRENKLLPLTFIKTHFHFQRITYFKNNLNLSAY